MTIQSLLSRVRQQYHTLAARVKRQNTDIRILAALLVFLGVLGALLLGPGYLFLGVALAVAVLTSEED